MFEKKQRILTAEEETFLASLNLTEAQTEKARANWETRKVYNGDKFYTFRLTISLIFIAMLISLFYKPNADLKNALLIYFWVNNIILISANGINLILGILNDIIYNNLREKPAEQKPEKYRETEKKHDQDCLYQPVFRMWRQEWKRAFFKTAVVTVSIGLLIFHQIPVTALLSLIAIIVQFMNMMHLKIRLDTALDEIKKNTLVPNVEINPQPDAPFGI